MVTTQTDLRATIAQSCRILGEMDITHAALGHVSQRIQGKDAMLIKAKGPDEVGLRYTRTRDIITVDFNADLVEGPDGLQPPSESFIHIWMYKTRPEVQSVIHMHPENAVLLTICGKEIMPVYGSYGSGARLAALGIPVYPRSETVHNNEMGQELAKLMGDKPACLMRGHGVTVVGQSVEEATLTTIALDEMTTMMYKAYLLGNPKPLPEEEIERLRRPPEEHRPRGSAGGAAGMMATWRYYKTLAEDRARRA
jgi:ribulose-5-phosphate 4-epimerase/fuculose-1-phosphate aldolase